MQICLSVEQTPSSQVPTLSSTNPGEPSKNKAERACPESKHHNHSDRCRRPPPILSFMACSYILYICICICIFVLHSRPLSPPPSPTHSHPLHHHPSPRRQYDSTPTGQAQRFVLLAIAQLKSASNSPIRPSSRIIPRPRSMRGNDFFENVSFLSSSTTHHLLCPSTAGRLFPFLTPT